MGHSFIPSDDAPATDPGHAAAIRRWTTEILKLGDDTTITVTETACVDPGCPLLETVITVFDPDGTRQWRLTRPRPAVTKAMILQTLATPPRRTH